MSSGSSFTSTELSSTYNITILIRNLDDATTSGNISVRYLLDANPAVNETVVAPSIPAGGFFDYTFLTSAKVSAVGAHNLKVNIAYTGDIVPKNDTIETTFKQLDNPFVNLTTGFLDDIESAAVQEHASRQVGLVGLDRYDFVASNSNGRIRSFINSGMAY